MFWRRLIFLVILLISIQVFAEVEEIANNYRGYGEEISRIMEVEYRNKTYYWIEYESVSRYSGSLIVKGNSAVRGRNTIQIFSAAWIIHSYYIEDQAEYMDSLANYLEYLSGRFSSPKFGNLSKDCREMATLARNSSLFLRNSITSFSPEDTEKYLEYDGELIERMNESYRHSKIRPEAEVEEYRKNLKDMLDSLSSNRENLLSSSEDITEMIITRVKSESKGSQLIPYIALSILLFIMIILIIRLRR